MDKQRERINRENKKTEIKDIPVYRQVSKCTLFLHPQCPTVGRGQPVIYTSGQFRS
jgi:hypothetical protein